MVIGLRLPLQSLPLDGLLGKHQHPETLQPLSFGELLKLKEKQLQQEQQVSAASIAAALATLQTQSITIPLPIQDVEVVDPKPSVDGPTQPAANAAGTSIASLSAQPTTARFITTESSASAAQAFSNTQADIPPQPAETSCVITAATPENSHSVTTTIAAPTNGWVNPFETQPAAETVNAQVNKSAPSNNVESLPYSAASVRTARQTVNPIRPKFETQTREVDQKSVQQVPTADTQTARDVSPSFTVPSGHANVLPTSAPVDQPAATFVAPANRDVTVAEEKQQVVMEPTPNEPVVFVAKTLSQPENVHAKVAPNADVNKPVLTQSPKNETVLETQSNALNVEAGKSEVFQPQASQPVRATSTSTKIVSPTEHAELKDNSSQVTERDSSPASNFQPKATITHNETSPEVAKQTYVTVDLPATNEFESQFTASADETSKPAVSEPVDRSKVEVKNEKPVQAPDNTPDVPSTRTVDTKRVVDRDVQQEAGFDAAPEVDHTQEKALNATQVRREPQVSSSPADVPTVEVQITSKNEVEADAEFASDGFVPPAIRTNDFDALPAKQVVSARQVDIPNADIRSTSKNEAKTSVEFTAEYPVASQIVNPETRVDVVVEPVKNKAASIKVPVPQQPKPQANTTLETKDSLQKVDTHVPRIDVSADTRPEIQHSDVKADDQVFVSETKTEDIDLKAQAATSDRNRKADLKSGENVTVPEQTSRVPASAAFAETPATSSRFEALSHEALQFVQKVTRDALGQVEEPSTLRADAERPTKSATHSAEAAENEQTQTIAQTAAKPSNELRDVEAKSSGTQPVKNAQTVATTNAELGRKETVETTETIKGKPVTPAKREFSQAETIINEKSVVESRQVDREPASQETQLKVDVSLDGRLPTAYSELQSKAETHMPRTAETSNQVEASSTPGRATLIEDTGTSSQVHSNEKPQFVRNVIETASTLASNVETPDQTVHVVERPYAVNKSATMDFARNSQTVESPNVEIAHKETVSTVKPTEIKVETTQSTVDPERSASEAKPLRMQSTAVPRVADEFTTPDAKIETKPVATTEEPTFTNADAVTRQDAALTSREPEKPSVSDVNHQVHIDDLPVRHSGEVKDVEARTQKPVEVSTKPVTYSNVEQTLIAETPEHAVEPKTQDKRVLTNEISTPVELVVAESVIAKEKTLDVKTTEPDSIPVSQKTVPIPTTETPVSTPPVAQVEPKAELKAQPTTSKDEQISPLEKRTEMNQMSGSLAQVTGPVNEARAVGFNGKMPIEQVYAQAAEVAQQVVRQMKSHLKSGSTSMHLELNPKELGAIKVDMVSNAQGVQVTFFAEQASTGRLLETQLNQLRDSLIDSGVQLSGLNIGQYNTQGQKGGTFSQESNLAPWPNEIFVEESRSNIKENPTSGLRFGKSSEVDYRI